MANIAVLLSGAGVFDGAEVNEVVLTLLHLEKNDAQYQCFAPNIEQMHTINHVSGDIDTTPRNVLEESARIARGDVKALAELDVAEFDALILPGGFGVAKNFCNFAVAGANMDVNTDVLAVCKSFHDAHKPAGYMCIAPVLLPKVYGQGVRCTVGNDPEVVAAIETMGGVHVECAVDDIVTDDKFQLVTTPAYMLAQCVSEAEQGISKLVARVVSMVG